MLDLDGFYAWVFGMALAALFGLQIWIALRVARGKPLPSFGEKAVPAPQARFPRMNEWLQLTVWIAWIGLLALLLFAATGRARLWWLVAVWFGLGVSIAVLMFFHPKGKALAPRKNIWVTAAVLTWLGIMSLVLLPADEPTWRILFVVVASGVLVEIALWKSRRDSSPDSREPPSP